MRRTVNCRSHHRPVCSPVVVILGVELLVRVLGRLVAVLAVLDDWLDGAGSEALGLDLRVLGLFAFLRLEESAAAHLE